MMETQAGIESLDEGVPTCDGPPIAVLWDQSLVWGLILFDTLRKLRVPFDLLTSDAVRRGSLDAYGVLVVPGGWASHKLHALGERGASEIKRFVMRGGCYLGFCGGAGLAMSSPPSLGLVPLERMDLADRLPNASGSITVRGLTGHPAWHGLPDTLPVSVWWPSQFAWHPMPAMLCLATYLAPGEDFCIADLPYQDLSLEAVAWEEWESIYGINLDPGRLVGHPAILELRVGRGRAVLSYPHLETPGDRWANRLLRRLIAYLGRVSKGPLRARLPVRSSPVNRYGAHGSKARASLQRVSETFDALIAFGERQFLWRWRSPWLLQWRRGIRGLEYGTLAVMARTARSIADVVPDCLVGERVTDASAVLLLERTQTFCSAARRLLLLEKLATQSGRLTKLGSVNETVDALRIELFGPRMSHGGLCGDLFDDLNRLLHPLLGACDPERALLP